jgi:HPt (histidine-containing phosphotransfer) domain-containing protein
MMKIDIVSSAPVLDVAGTLARFGGDQQLFRDIIEFFLEDSPPLLADLRQAVCRKDAVAVRSTAHALKGLAAGCGGSRAAQAAQRVENAGAANDLDNVDGLMGDLENELGQLRRAACDCQS